MCVSQTTQFKGRVPKTVLLIPPKLGAFKTTLNFNNSQGLTELTESYYTRGYSLSQGKDTDLS